jgi:ABC-type transport system substrate-binding protein
MAELITLVETDNPMNFSNFSMPAIDPLIRQAAALTDETRRKALYEEAIRLYTPQYPLIPLYYSYGSRGYSSDLTIVEGWVQYDKAFYYRWK